MLKLLRFLKNKWYLAALAPLVMALEVVCDLMQPTLMSEIVDVGVANSDISFIVSTGLRMLGISALGALGGILCTVFSSMAGMHFGMNMRQAAFSHVQTLSFAEIDTLQPASLITRLTNDVTQLQDMLMMALRMAVRAPVMCIGGVVMAYILSPRLSLILVIAMPLLLVVVMNVMRRAFPLFGEMQKRVDDVNGSMRETMMGMRVIKAFVSFDRVQHNFDTANDNLMNTNIKVTRILIIMGPAIQFIMNMSIVAVLYYGGYQAIETGSVTMGEVMAFLNYLTQILSSLVMVSMMLMSASRATASAKRINEIFDTATTISNPDSPIVPENYTISFEDVSFAYPGTGEDVLEHINLTIPEGETIGIIGSTGSGKSSLVSLIPRLYDATSGRITVGGTDVRKLDLHTLRDRIGIVLQESILFKGSVEENLRWGDPDASGESMQHAAEDAQAHSFIEALADGYASPVEQRGRNFSGGQKQRLSIARVLLKHPRVMILDDSTSALDLATEARLQSAVAESMSHITLIIIAQRISSVANADRIVVMDDGKISAVGPHKELIKTSEIYRSIVASQWGEEALNHVE